MRWATIATALVALIVWPASAGLKSGYGRDGARNDTASVASTVLIRLAQSDGLAIDAPRRITTDQETVDLAGRVSSPGEITPTVNGMPAPSQTAVVPSEEEILADPAVGKAITKF